MWFRYTTSIFAGECRVTMKPNAAHLKTTYCSGKEKWRVIDPPRRGPNNKNQLFEAHGWCRRLQLRCVSIWMRMTVQVHTRVPFEWSARKASMLKDPMPLSSTFLRVPCSDIRWYIHSAISTTGCTSYMCVIAGMRQENFRYYVLDVPRANGNCHARTKFFRRHRTDRKIDNTARPSRSSLFCTLIIHMSKSLLMGKGRKRAIIEMTTFGERQTALTRIRVVRETIISMYLHANVIKKKPICRV